MKHYTRRAVIDTNVLISAALSSGTPPAQVTHFFVAQVTHFFLAHGRILFSRETFAELEERLWRPKFDRYPSIEMRKLLLHDFDAVADWGDLERHPDVTGTRHSRDATDDTFIHTALAGGADLLVSGDRDLLDLGVVAGLPILSPADALALIRPAG